MTTGDVTAELLDLFGGLIGGADVDFVSFCKKKQIAANISKLAMNV